MTVIVSVIANIVQHSTTVNLKFNCAILFHTFCRFHTFLVRLPLRKMEFFWNGTETYVIGEHDVQHNIWNRMRWHIEISCLRTKKRKKEKQRKAEKQ